MEGKRKGMTACKQIKRDGKGTYQRGTERKVQQFI
jgi:hypothetical protein